MTAQGPTIDAAWALVEAVLPEGYFISAVRTRSKIGRWSASATLDLDPMGANWSGFGPTPVDALLDLRAKLLDRESYKNPSTGPERHSRYTATPKDMEISARIRKHHRKAPRV
jgi:hypothetical protein